MKQFVYTLFNRGRFNSVFPKILAIVLFRILLHGILENFACNILTLKADIIFVSSASWGQGCHNFSKIFGKM